METFNPASLQNSQQISLVKEAENTALSVKFTFLPSKHESVFIEMLAIILFDFADVLTLIRLRLMRH